MDVNDLTIVLTKFGRTSDNVVDQGGLTGSGTVDVNDLTILLTYFGTGSGAAALGRAGAGESGGTGRPRWPRPQCCSGGEVKCYGESNVKSSCCPVFRPR